MRSKPKSKWRPLPLDTVVSSASRTYLSHFLVFYLKIIFQELEKLASRKLRINAKNTMHIAEKLYTAGYISYPRTETNMFPKDLDLVSLVEMQIQSRQWGGLYPALKNFARSQLAVIGSDLIILIVVNYVLLSGLVE